MRTCLFKLNHLASNFIPSVKALSEIFTTIKKETDELKN
jgi:hypothetical protein